MAKTLDLRTYVLLERSFVRRLQRTWAQQSAPTYAAIAQACKDHKWDEARRLVTDLDMYEVGKTNREWISYMLLSCAVFGAGLVAKNKPSFVGVGTFDTLLQQVTSTFLQYLEHGATSQVQAQALQSIAEDESKSLVQKQEHEFGNTQIQIDPWSSAALSLNNARNAINDADLMATGKDVDPNHVTVRFGLLNTDVDALRDFIASCYPFEAQVVGIDMFPASDHSEGAIPVIARIESPELHAIEAKIGEYADFKEKNFPDYQPHCTLAYCKPEAAAQYTDLIVGGSFLVSGITISHQSGVKETIPFGITRKYNPYHDKTGEFTSKERAVKAGMRVATDDDAEKLKEWGVPKGWADVHIAIDPNAALRATGLDVKGRTQYKYSPTHNKGSDASKFERVREFPQVLPRLRRAIARDMESPNQTIKDAATVLHLIDKTGFRVGSDEDTLADVDAFGATTLLDKHAVVNGSKVTFSFIGKKGVLIEKVVTDTKLAKEIAARKRKTKANEPLFNTTDAKVRKYMAKTVPGFSPKDFRTHQGTGIAVIEIKKRPPVKTEKEYAAAQKEIATIVAAHLGNTPAVSLKSYIDPMVWERLRRK